MLTLKQIQDIYGVSRQAIHKWRTYHNMPSMKFGHAVLFNEQEVKEWYAKYKNKK